MTTDDEKQRHQMRRRNHIAKDLRNPKLFKHQVVDPKRTEDEEERRLRRYGIGIDYDDV